MSIALESTSGEIAGPSRRGRRRRWVGLVALVLLLGAAATAIVPRPWQSRTPELPDGLFLPTYPVASFADTTHGFLLLGSWTPLPFSCRSDDCH
jgi:hypothetical protein